AQIYVLPSLCEPFGMSILEAMSCGLPVIVTDAGGAPEVVGANNSEFVVPVRDSEKLAEKIISLLLNYEKCKSKGKDNREYAVRNFDWRLISAKYNSLYDEICG
ncbi:glycosyltransferase family 4 protein, partial [Candidatus Dependentiae bacterium]|nr:glycosyltransferase family 4 protein [Candidatus Dependentiae bacterium]